ncbi:S-protein homolog 21 [Ricinus communis]|uniref:S-protein homolog n=1 Tax=Ricinus communis TaxID=3988 RepID=B9RWQ9_RICCO|nr:S-protein homolog 21 [Ricinus communis]EEF44311.1 conserved hypothetical protein [Ricinus communis]|eukprot:XP_002518178.1 S-protein homolog 21 [Ricinus communis]
MAPTLTIFCLIFLLSTTIYLHPVLAWRPTLLETDKLFCIKYRVHVMNGLSSNENPLYIHCQSRDDDLGDHTLNVGGDFNFKFRIKLIGPNTWFSCDMVWGSKHQHVDVFRQKVEGPMCCADGNSCYWRAQDDGIYFSTNNVEWIRRYEWF